jgi:hypothetical protein
VGDRGVLDVDSIVLAEILEGGAGEGCAQIGDDPIGHTEAVCDISDELCSFFRCYFRNRSDFNPLGEFVDGDQNVFVAAWAVRNGPTESRPHMEKGHDGGIVRRT